MKRSQYRGLWFTLPSQQSLLVSWLFFGDLLFNYFIILVNSNSLLEIHFLSSEIIEYKIVNELKYTNHDSS